MSTKPVKEITVLEDSVLLSIAQNKTIVGEFPFLQTLLRASKKKQGCGSCSGTAKPGPSEDFMNVKRMIADMGDDRKRRLRELLGTRQVKIYFERGGKIQKMTF